MFIAADLGPENKQYLFTTEEENRFSAEGNRSASSTEVTDFRIMNMDTEFTNCPLRD